MFEEKLNEMLCWRGMSEEAFLSALREEEFLSDNVIFTIGRFINNINPNVILTKTIGDLMVTCRRFGIAITFEVKTANPVVINLDFIGYSFIVKYKDMPPLVIDRNLIDYQGEHNKLADLRQLALNEIMTRYFSKILFAIYKELRWFL